MDGEVFSNIIKGTTIFPVLDEPMLSVNLLSLPQAMEVMKRLGRAFNLNIKNSEHCVFFKIFVNQGLKVADIVHKHLLKLNEFLKLNYIEKK